VEVDAAFASAALASAMAAVPQLEVRDRALATELTYGVLRWRGALDAALSACAPRGITSLDPEVLGALRVAAYQLVHLDRIPPAAAVSAAVDQVRARRGERMAAFVNGLLRALGRSEAAMALGRDDARAHPSWLVDVLSSVLPARELAAALAASNRPAPTCLRANERRTTSEALAARLAADFPGATVTLGVLASTCVRVAGIGDPQATAAFAEGLYTVQDEGAQVVVEEALAAVLGKPAPRVLDACAGRGGKTGALAEALGPAARIDAVDRHPDKLARLGADLTRLGLARPGVRALAIDLEIGQGPLEPGYDLVLCDAPCTGTGVIRRRPEVRLRRTPDDVRRLVAVQRTLLARLAPLVAPGGTLVYCVCSIVPDEGPAIVAAPPAGLRLVGSRMLWPHRDDTDGFFIARLQRPA
jgi:16S rRNA (cytosine967-C5)-methyltransferase